MATQRNQRPTRSTKAASGRVPAAKPNNTPLIIGACVGGALLLIVIIAVASSGGGKPDREKTPKTDASRPAAPDQEREGASLCSRGKSALDLTLFNGIRSVTRADLHAKACGALADLRKGLAAYAAAAKITGTKYPIDGYSNAFDEGCRKLENDARMLGEHGRKTFDTESPGLAGPQKEKAIPLVEDALKDMREAVESFARLAAATEKSYPSDNLKRAFDAGVERYARDLEAEAATSIKDGLAIIKSTEDQLTKGFTEAEKPALRDKLEKGVHLISHGNNLRDRVYQVSGRQYEDSAANQAYKAAKMKLLELTR